EEEGSARLEDRRLKPGGLFTNSGRARECSPAVFMHQNGSSAVGVDVSTYMSISNASVIHPRMVSASADTQPSRTTHPAGAASHRTRTDHDRRAPHCSRRTRRFPAPADTM